MAAFRGGRWRDSCTRQRHAPSASPSPSAGLPLVLMTNPSLTPTCVRKCLTTAQKQRAFKTSSTCACGGMASTQREGARSTHFTMVNRRLALWPHTEQEKGRTPECFWACLESEQIGEWGRRSKVNKAYVATKQAQEQQAAGATTTTTTRASTTTAVAAAPCIVRSGWQLAPCQLVLAVAGVAAHAAHIGLLARVCPGMHRDDALLCGTEAGPQVVRGGGGTWGEQEEP